MDKNEISQNDDSHGSHEDTEIMQYKKCSLNVINFHMVYDENDLNKTQRKRSFSPDMAHQVFGETEMIFGYKHLCIDLFYLHNSAKCYVDLQFSAKIVEREGCKADDIMAALNPWLPPNYRTNKVDFLKDVNEEDHAVMYGEVIDNFEDSQNKTYKITLCDTKNEDFRNFHQRFETFIVWFIDGANYIDLEDTRWMIFYVYEEYLDPKTNKMHHSPVGFCTVYKFFLYPNAVRPRISQFFVLPNYQKRGIGTQLYRTVYNYLKELPDSGDITVEEPTEIFQKIRDYCDSLQVYENLTQHNIAICTQNQKKISDILRQYKLCKRQAQRVFDILECLIAHKNGYEEYVKFTNNIKTRIGNEVEKEIRGCKRLCNLERSSVPTDHLDNKAIIEAEYNRYIDSLEWPTKHIRAFLAKKIEN